MNNHIGERLQVIRKSKNLTQTEFGKIFGVTHAHISSIERGKENPSEMFILFIIEKFKIDEKWFRSGEGEMYSLDGINTTTDNGNLKKFDMLNTQLINYISNINGQELKIAIKLLSYFNCMLIIEDFEKDIRISYLQNLQIIFKDIDMLFADANSLAILKDRSGNYKDLLRLSSKTNEHLTNIDKAIKEVLNMYIDKYISYDELGFKCF